MPSDIFQADIDYCRSIPCLNGATCTNVQNYYKCSCVAGYSGYECETGIIIRVTTHISIGSVNWNLLINIINN